MGRAGRMILNQNVSRAPKVSVFDVEGHLMGREVNFAAPLDYLQLDHDEHPMWECQQAIRNAEVYARLNPGEMAVWDIVPDPFVQVRFRFQGHQVLPRRVLRQFV